MPRRLLLLTLMAILVGCNGTETSGRATQPVSTGTRDIQIVAKDYAFAPEILEALPGETLRITLINQGSHDHSLVIGGGQKSRGEMNEILKPNESATMVYRMPENVAYVEFHCPIARHGSRGMTGRIVAKRTSQ